MTFATLFVRSIVLTGITLSLGAVSGCRSAVTGPSSSSTLPGHLHVTVGGMITGPDGAPVAGVLITASIIHTGSVSGKRQSVGYTKSDGRILLEALDILPADRVLFEAAKSLYTPFSQMLSPASSGEINLDVKLSLRPALPSNGSVTSTLLTSDPGAYIGEPYDSDYAWQASAFSFEAPAAADLDVVLTWSPAGNASLFIGAVDAAGTWTQSAPQRIRIPRGTTGVLTVGQSYAAGALTQPVTFTLTVTPVSGYASVR